MVRSDLCGPPPASGNARHAVSEAVRQLRTDSTLEVAYDGLVRELRRRDFSEKTIRTWSWALEDLFAFLRANDVDDLADVTRDRLERWQDQLLDRKLKPSSRQSAATAARKLLRWASDRDIVDWRLERAIASVRIKRDKRRHPIPRADLEKILRWVHWRPSRMTIIDLRDRALFVFLLVTAARVNEALQALRSDYTAPVVVQKGGSEKTLHTSATALDLIHEYLQARRRDESAWLWIKHGNNINAEGERLNDSGVREMCTRISLDLQIRRFTPHNIRHTSASYMTSKKVSPAIVAGWLGHANLATLMDYVELDDEAIAEASKTMEQLVKAPASRPLPPASRGWRDYVR